MPAKTKSKNAKKNQSSMSKAAKSTNKPSQQPASAPAPKTSHLGVTALAARLEKLEKENDRLRKMNASLKESALPEPAATSHPQVVLIPKPPGEVGRSGESKPGYGLLEAMGMDEENEEEQELYNTFRAYVRAQCHAFDVNDGTYKDQSVDRLSAICRQAKKKFPWLEAYQKDWPVLDVIRQYLQGRGYHKRRKIVDKAKAKAEAKNAGLALSDTDEDENITNFDPLVALGYKDTASEHAGFGDVEEPPVEAEWQEEGSDDEVPPVDAQIMEGGCLELPSEDKIADDNTATLYEENTAPTSDTAIQSPAAITKEISPSLPVWHDSHSVAIFVDSKGYFFDSQGAMLEANWDRIEGKYILKDGREMDIPDYPTTFRDYDSCFNDGKKRMQNVKGHWKVGNIIPNPDNFLSPRSRALASHSSASPTPSLFQPRRNMSSITNVILTHSTPQRTEKSPWDGGIAGSPLSSIHDGSPPPALQLMETPPLNLKIKIPPLKASGKSSASKMLTVATAQPVLPKSKHATRSSLKRPATVSETKKNSNKKAKNVAKPMD